MLIGQPMRLLPFERQWILDTYDNPHGTRMSILSMARKNGKTALIACLVLVHLVGPEAKMNSQVVSGAMSRDQAALVYKFASKMVRMSPRLSLLVKPIPSSKKLIGIPMNVEYQALSADAKRNHGHSPAFAVLDEVGQVRGPKSEFVDAITTAQGAYKGALTVVISTQAANDGDLLSLWIDDALTSKDPHVICHLHSAPEDCDVMDYAAWKAANPALGVFRDENELRQFAETAARMPAQESTFRNLYLNQRVEAISPFINRSIWKERGTGINEELFREVPVYAGLDLSGRVDLTSLVLVAKESEDDPAAVMHIKPFFWTPEIGLLERAKRDRVPYDLWVKQGYLFTTPGGSVDYAFVARFIADLLSAGVNIVKLAFDRWRIDIFKKELDRLDVSLDLVPFGQGFRDFSPALDEFEARIASGTIVHGNHPVLTMCMMNSRIIKDEAGNRKLDKKRSGGRIDGAVAGVMAITVAKSNDDSYSSADEHLIILDG
jgi:phage terminase large subunit-like protein